MTNTNFHLYNLSNNLKVKICNSKQNYYNFRKLCKSLFKTFSSVFKNVFHFNNIEY